MEVSFVSQEGIPEDAIFSVRSGGVKRQAPASAAKPFRFPKVVKEAKDGSPDDSLLKFDILQKIGTGYAVLKPFGARYRVGFGDGTGMAAEVDVRQAGPDQPMPEAKPTKEEVTSKAANAREAQEYLEKHGVLQFVQAIVQAVIKERPSDPYLYMGRQFLQGYEKLDELGTSAKAAPKTSTSADASLGQAAAPDVPLATSTPIEPLKMEKSAAPPAPAPRVPPGAALPEPSSEAKQAPPLVAEAKQAPPPTTCSEAQSLRARVQDRLHQASNDGTLEEVLSRSDDVRAQTKGILEEAFLDGSLEKAIAEETKKVAQERTSQAQQKEQQDAFADKADKDVSEVKSKIRDALEQGQKDGTLEKGLQHELANAKGRVEQAEQAVAGPQESKEMEDAIVKIQSAHRGKAVRKSLKQQPGEDLSNVVTAAPAS